MKLTIFAATAGIGGQVVDQALAAGHDVTAVIRTPSIASVLVRTVLREQYADLARMEDLLLASGLDWTAVRPPRPTNGPLTGRYRTAYGRKLRGGVSISRADVAHYMVRALTDPTSIGKTVGVTP